MLDLSTLLGQLPTGLRTPLLREYKKLTSNYLQHRWEPAQLSAGKICEIVYSIIKGYADGSFPSAPSKPRSMYRACQQLENETNLPRSFRILIPRMLPALYEIRNNRGVGHVGGDVSPNNTDATLMLTMVNWIIAELIRVFHTTDISSAQLAIDRLSERIIPIVWESQGIKKVLKTGLGLREKILILLSTDMASVSIDQLMIWTESTNKSHYKKILSKLHKDKLVHLDKNTNVVTLLPTGSKEVSRILN